MSLGAGHILDMINRIKQNEAIRPSHRAKFKDHREPIYTSHFNRVTYDFPEVSDSELKEIKQSIRREAGRERKKQLAAIVLTTVIILIFTILVWSKFG